MRPWPQGREAQEGCVEAATVWLQSPWGVEFPLGPDTPTLCVCNPLHNMCTVFVNIHSTYCGLPWSQFRHRYPPGLCPRDHTRGGAVPQL